MSTLQSPARRLSALVLLLLAVLVRPTAAQQTTGTVAGQVLDAAAGAPVPLSLVYLVPAAGPGEPLQRTVTDQAGAFRFDAVPAGSYRLRVERIGYTALPSEAFQVQGGGTAREVLRTAFTPVQIEGITVAGNACYTLDRLEQAPDLAVLWREAQKALETRRSFQEQYRYRFDMHLDGGARMRFMHDKRMVKDSTVVSDPDTVRARAARARKSGYGQQRGNHITIRVPSEIELLSDGFLRDHCLEGDPGGAADGKWTLNFRPVRPSRDRLDLRGTVVLDTETFRVRELDYDYVEGDQRIGRATLAFGDVRTPIGVVRLPVGGTMVGKPGGVMGLVVQGFSGTMTLRNYRDFERVRTGGSPAADAR